MIFQFINQKQMHFSVLCEKKQATGNKQSCKILHRFVENRRYTDYGSDVIFKTVSSNQKDLYVMLYSQSIKTRLHWFTPYV